MAAPRFVLDRFWPSNLFLGGIPGAWYDPTDLSTMFQDSAGTTPVTAVEQPVGLILDKSQGLALGASIGDGPDTGTFTALGTTPPTANGNDTYLGLSCRSVALPSGVNGFAASRAVGATFVVPTTTVYLVTYQIALSRPLTGSESIRVYVTGTGGVGDVFLTSASATPTAWTTYQRYVAPTAAWNQFLTVFPQANLSSPCTVYVRGFLYQLVAGNHASQSTAASRPTYRARYNLLTQSEDFGNAVWIKFNSSVSTNVATAPDGTGTADALIEDTANTLHFVYVSRSVLSAPGIATFSCYLKASTRTSAVLQIAEGTNRFATLFDLTNGVVAATNTTGTPTSTSNSIVAVGSGWYRCIVSCAVATTCDAIVALSNSLTPTWSLSVPTYLGNGTGDVFVWGAQVMSANDVTATGNAYQRIAAATVYDTAPIFRPYLAFDGLDDSLATAAIDFTSTDKMTVFAGVTKQSDAISFAVLAELSPITTNPGMFAVFGSASAGAARYATTLNGSTASRYEPTPFPAPQTNVVAVSFDIAGAVLADEIKPRFNGVLNQTNPSGANCGTGNFGNYSLYVGARNSSALYFNCRLYSLIVRGAASSTTEIIDTETWVNARTGGY